MKVNLKLLEVSPNSALESASLFAGNLVMITINNVKHIYILSKAIKWQPRFESPKSYCFQDFSIEDAFDCSSRSTHLYV